MKKIKLVKHDDVIREKMRDAKFQQVFKKEQGLAKKVVKIAEKRE